jgi:small subunit ribosomal protein S16
MGRRNRPSYRIVAIDSRVARDGRYLDNLGTYNPLVNPAQIELSEEKAIYWLNNGAIPSDTVKSFLKKKGILFKMHLMKKGMDGATIEEEFKKWQAQQLEKTKKDEALREQKKRESKKKKGATAAPAEVEAKSEAPVEAKSEAPAETKTETQSEAEASPPSATTEAAPEQAAEPTTEGEGQKS